jgi:hypothetical protein
MFAGGMHAQQLMMQQQQQQAMMTQQQMMQQQMMQQHMMQQQMMIGVGPAPQSGGGGDDEPAASAPRPSVARSSATPRKQLATRAARRVARTPASVPRPSVSQSAAAPRKQLASAAARRAPYIDDDSSDDNDDDDDEGSDNSGSDDERPAAAAAAAAPPPRPSVARSSGAGAPRKQLATKAAWRAARTPASVPRPSVSQSAAAPRKQLASTADQHYIDSEWDPPRPSVARSSSGASAPRKQLAAKAARKVEKLSPGMSAPCVIRWLRSTLDPRHRFGYCDLTAELNSCACVTRVASHMLTHHKAAKDGLTGKALLGLKLKGAKKPDNDFKLYCWPRHPSELQAVVAAMLDVDEARAPPEPPVQEMNYPLPGQRRQRLRLGTATAADMALERTVKTWEAWQRKVVVANECALVIERHIKQWKDEDKLAKATAKKAKKLQAALQKCSEWDPTASSPAVHAMAIDPIRKAVLSGIETLKEFCAMRRVSKEWRGYIDASLTPQLKMILKNQNLEKDADMIRKLKLSKKPQAVVERQVIEAKQSAEFGPEVSATVSSYEVRTSGQVAPPYCVTVERRQDDRKAAKVDALVRRSKGKPFCKLQSAAKLGAAAYRCDTHVLRDAGMSKDALCDVVGLTPSSSAAMWSGARDLGILQFRSGRTAKGGGWRAGGAWEGWLGVRIVPSSCDRDDCKACRAFQTLLLPRCIMAEKAEDADYGAGDDDSSSDSETESGPPRPSVAAGGAPRKQLAKTWKVGSTGAGSWRAYQQAADGSTGVECGGAACGCRGDCEAWRAIPILRDCLAEPSKLATAAAATAARPKANR